MIFELKQGPNHQRACKVSVSDYISVASEPRKEMFGILLKSAPLPRPMEPWSEGTFKTRCLLIECITNADVENSISLLTS